MTSKTDTSKNGKQQKSDGSPEHFDIVMIGAGFAGLHSVYKFRQAGYKVRAYEKGGDVGGVWYFNRYPGARCDCPTYIYSFAFSEELQQEWSWSLDYAKQPEILKYLNHVADRFDLRRDIQCNTTVTSAHFDEKAGHWLVTLSEGPPVTAQFVVAASGCLSAPLKTKFKGLENFKGELYYTSHWPHEGVDLTGKRVGLVGTGASGVQTTVEIAPVVKELTVFQRTANWAVPVWNGPTD